MPKLASSPCAVRCFLHSHQPSAPSAPHASFANRQPFNSSPLRSLAQPHHYGILDEPWLSPSPVTPPSPTPSSTFFSHNGYRRQINSPNGSMNNDHKPPNERVLKLGSSKLMLFRTWTAPCVAKSRLLNWEIMLMGFLLLRALQLFEFSRRFSLPSSYTLFHRKSFLRM